MAFVDAAPPGLPREVLLLVHGLLDFCYGWRKQIPFFVSRGYRVLAPNVRGFNLGDPNPDPGDAAGRTACYSHVSAVEDLVRLLDIAGVPRAVVVGHGQDLGGTVATRLALLHPSRVSRLILIGQPYQPPPEFFIPPALEARTVPLTSYRTYMASAQAAADLNANPEAMLHVAMRRGAETGGMLRAMSSLKPGTPFAELAAAIGPSTILTPEEVSTYVAFFRSIGGIAGPLQWIRGGNAVLPPGTRREILCPALYVAPELGVFSGEPYRADMRRLVPDLEVVEVQGAGSFLHVEMPDVVNEAVLRWLEARPPPAG
ncbi:Alpha/Beta hydrolase protein [Hyaloraphidium curvatum]|nr:Alpha/Beta hydrolase protein [Hyaloraphidium curvatum]